MTESMVYSCPKCGGRLVAMVKRVKLLHLFATKEGGLRTKTGVREVHYCARCNQHFLRTIALLPVEVVEPERPL